MCELAVAQATRRASCVFKQEQSTSTASNIFIIALKSVLEDE